MTAEESLKLLVELTAAYPATRMPTETAVVWRTWLQALPYAEAKRAVAMVCAQQDFPTVHQMIAACGITAEPVLALLVAAKDGGYEIVRDDTSKNGWRSSREALPEPPKVRTPMPADVKESIQAALAKIEARHVNGRPGTLTVDPAIEAELREANQRFEAAS